MMNPIVMLIFQILSIYEWIVIGTVILSWLVAFNVVNMANPFVRQVAYVLGQLTEPVLGPIRRMLPYFGGVDLAPVVLLLLLWFIRYSLAWLVMGY